MEPRKPDLETLQYQNEQLTTAVQALTSLTRTPQERLDRALSYFTRTFRDDPSGHAFALWRRIYKAIGDPPRHLAQAAPRLPGQAPTERQPRPHERGDLVVQGGEVAQRQPARPPSRQAAHGCAHPARRATPRDHLTTVRGTP